MFRFNDTQAVSFSDQQPEKVDVVIIGGGIIGISSAWYLLNQGLSVFVAEKGRVAGEQSSRNWGWVRVTWRDEAEVPVAIDSLKCWKEITSEIDEDTGFTVGGIIGLARSEQEFAEFESWMPIAKAHDMDTHLLSRAELKNHLNMPSDGWFGGMVTPSDARAEPFKAVPAIARGVQARGGLIRENCAVRTLEYEGENISGVVTEDGPVRAEAVLCAAGAWSNMFLANMGVSFPQLSIKGTVARTAKAPELFSGATALHDIYVRRRQDGGYTVGSEMTEHLVGANSFRYMTNFIPARGGTGDLRLRFGGDVTQPSFFGGNWTGEDKTPFEVHRVLNPKPSPTALALMRKNLNKRLPEMEQLEFVETWAGMIDATPDVVPVMDEITGHPGLFLASGFSGHGFGIGPGAGKVMANLIGGKVTGFDLDRFRFSRFSDGSKMVPGPAI